MSDNDTSKTIRHEAPTRRQYVKYGGAVVGGGLLAGCTGGSGDESTSESATTSESSESAEEDTSYEVCMSPVDCVEFSEPPESVFTVLLHHTDMALALGYGEAINAIYSPQLFGRLYNMFLERIDGVSVDWANVLNSWNPDKETLYELDSDIHLADPAYVTSMDAWDTEDIEEIRTNVAPWFGNTFSDHHRTPPEPWAEKYQYYTLYEIFAKVAEVFQRRDRYEAFETIHSDLVSEIRSKRPPESDRPRVARIQFGLSNGDLTLYPFNINEPGFEQAHLRPLGVEDAFPELEAYATVDLETVVESDPEVILATHAMGPERNFSGITDALKSDSVAQEISAVKNNRLYPMAIRYGGPIANLFQLEMAAKQVYPSQFGEWPENSGGSYPNFSEGEQLFDRGRVADIINGDI